MTSPSILDENGAIINMVSGSTLADLSKYFTYNPNSNRFFVGQELNVMAEFTLENVSEDETTIKINSSGLSGGYIGLAPNGLTFQRNQYFWKFNGNGDQISFESGGRWIGLSGDNITMTQIEYFWDIKYITHGETYLEKRCVGTVLESPECVNWVSSTSSIIANKSLNDFCSQSLNITTEVCQNACKSNIHVNCDNSLKEYCSSISFDNPSETILNTCSCHMSDEFYKNLSATITPILNYTVSENFAREFMPSCTNALAIQTYEKKNSSVILGKPYTCIKELFMTPQGVVKYVNISNDEDCVNFKPAEFIRDISKLKISEKNEIKYIIAGSAIVILIGLIGMSLAVRAHRNNR